MRLIKREASTGEKLTGDIGKVGGGRTVVGEGEDASQAIRVSATCRSEQITEDVFAIERWHASAVIDITADHGLPAEGFLRCGDVGIVENRVDGAGRLGASY